jgi:hypothetical protein
MNTPTPNTPYHKQALSQLAFGPDQTKYNWNANPSVQYGYERNINNNLNGSPVDLNARRNLLETFQTNDGEKINGMRNERQEQSRSLHPELNPQMDQLGEGQPTDIVNGPQPMDPERTIE